MRTAGSGAPAEERDETNDSDEGIALTVAATAFPPAVTRHATAWRLATATRGAGTNSRYGSVNQQQTDARRLPHPTNPGPRPEELFFVFWGPRIDGLAGMYSDSRLDPTTGRQMSSNISFPAYQSIR